MKQHKEMPTEGQFVAVWSNSLGLWSGVYKWIGGDLNEYELYTENKFHTSGRPDQYNDGIIYFTQD